ncbi:hypothetical protein KJ966_29620 [bacterium]|nr:hypothetical protein [bacterium]
MNLFITIIAVLMVSDAAFTLLNLSKVESLITNHFPKMNVKKLATVEGITGIVILFLKLATGTIV